MEDYSIMNRVRFILETMYRDDYPHPWKETLKGIDKQTPCITTGGYYWGKSVFDDKFQGLTIGGSANEGNKSFKWYAKELRSR